uniref:TRAF1-6 MATH domain-containing protein n=1 Tax=Bubo bubo TaxID=30461 RepID=A0A8C0ESL8_BUBBB
MPVWFHLSPFCRGSANVLGWDGGDPVGHGGCVTGDMPFRSPDEGVFKCPEDQLPLDYAKTFHPDPNWKNFQKPGASRSSLDESTLGFGYPKFISHEDIKKRNYVRDNAIFIKASVEIPQKILA